MSDAQEPHDAAEAYTNLANAEFLAHQASPRAPGYLESAERDYRLALSFVPTYDQASKNLQVVYRLAQMEKRLKAVSGPAPQAEPGRPWFTGYEVVPSKG